MKLQTYARVYTHAPVTVVVYGHSQDLCQALTGVRGPTVPSGSIDGCTPSPVCLFGYGEGSRQLWPVPLGPLPCIFRVHKTVCLGQAWGVNGAWGTAGGWESLPGAPVGLPSLGQQEKRSLARKPLRRCPHYITDIPATEPASLRRGASLNAKQDEAPSGRAAEPAERLLLSAAAGGQSGGKGDSTDPKLGSGRWMRGGGGERRPVGECEDWPRGRRRARG